MRILIIGGTRFIGPPLVRRLHDLGHAIWLFHRHRAEVPLPEGVNHIRGDRAHLGDFAATFRRIAPDVVIDMIALTEQDSRLVVDMFKGIAGRLVSISSQDVYRAYGRIHGTEPGPSEPTPLTEDSPLRSKLYLYRSETPREPNDPRQILDHYEKILVERVARSEPDLPATILRLPMVYGPNDYQHRLYPYLKRMDDGRPAILLNDQMARWRWTRDYVGNTAAAIALAATHPRAVGQIYNVGERTALTTADWIRAIGQIAGWQGQIVTVPDYQLPIEMQSHAGLDQELVADTSRIRTELGFVAHFTREEGLRRTIEWERAHPPDIIDPRLFDYATEDEILSWWL